MIPNVDLANTILGLNHPILPINRKQKDMKELSGLEQRVSQKSGELYSPSDRFIGDERHFNGVICNVTITNTDTISVIITDYFVKMLILVLVCLSKSSSCAYQ